MLNRMSFKSVIDKPVFNVRNLTLRKAVYFAVVSGIGGGVLLGLTYLFTEVLGYWYMVSIILGGGVALVIKFVLNTLWTYRD